MKALLFIAILLSGSVAYCQQTALDSSFATNGILVVDSPAQMQNNKIAIQGDGRIVLAGTYYYYLLPSFDLVYELRIMRFMPDGRPDSSFNGNGIFTKLTDRSTRMAALNIQSDGKILITGSTNFLERYLPDGTPDSSFNDSARVQITSFTPYDYLSATAIAPDGKIVTVGYRGQQVMLVARLKPDGPPDSTFGYNGEVTTMLDSAYSISGNAVVVQPDGKILAAGGSIILNGSVASTRMAVVRYDDAGYFDPTFNNGRGYIQLAIPGYQYSTASSIGLQPNGKIVVAGNVSSPAGSTVPPPYNCIARLTAGGIFDTTFGNHGFITSDTNDVGSPYNTVTQHVKLQPDGKILLITTDNSQPPNRKFALRRFTANGGTDATFGYNGKVTTDITNNQDVPHDIAVQADGKILVCGISDMDDHWPLTNHSLPTIVRYHPNVKLGVPSPKDGLNMVRVYPNPATNKLTISYQLPGSAKVSVYLSDITGRCVQQWNYSVERSGGAHNEDLSLAPALTAGVYFLVLDTDRGRQIVRIVKE